MYKISKNGVIVRLSDGALIPEDSLNIDRMEYVKWQLEGNTPEPEFTPAELIENQKANIRAQLLAIEARAFMRRGQRESWLAQATQQLSVQGITHAQAYAANPEYKRVFDENEAATALRDQLKNL